MDAWLFAGGVTNLLVTPIYAYVGARLYERSVSSRARLPSTQFAVWWWGLGGLGVIAGVEAILYSVGWLTFALGFTLYLLTVLGDCLILWGLVGYLLYLYTGKYHLLEVSAFYAAFYTTALYWVISSGPNGVALSAAGPVMTYAHPLGGPVFAAVILGLVFPEVIAGLLYFSLIRRTQDRTLRYRIAMVSAALFVFFGAASYTPPPGVGYEVWSLVKALLDASSALLALFAYFPPEALRRTFRVSAVPREEPRGEAIAARP